MAIFWSFGGFHGIKWLNSMQFSYKLVCPSILIQMLDKISLKVISQQNIAKMAILWPKIASATLARAWHDHNLAIFHPIVTNEYTKMTCSSRRIEWNKQLSSISLLLYFCFWTPFMLQDLTWAILYLWTQFTTLKLLVHVLAIMANSYLKFSQKSGLNPFPPPPH